MEEKAKEALDLSEFECQTTTLQSRERKSMPDRTFNDSVAAGNAGDRVHMTRPVMHYRKREITKLVDKNNNKSNLNEKVFCNHEEVPSCGNYL